MAHGTFQRFHQFCDIFGRVVTTNPAGQKVGSFSSIKTSVPCYFQSVSGERRISPYVDHVDEYRIVFSHIYQEYVSYDYRIKNIKDRYGNIVYEGPFEIFQINKMMGFNGKVNLLDVTLRLAVENG